MPTLVVEVRKLLAINFKVAIESQPRVLSRETE
jgi:hypothetical protein